MLYPLSANYNVFGAWQYALPKENPGTAPVSNELLYNTPSFSKGKNNYYLHVMLSCRTTSIQNKYHIDEVECSH
jgi:hypothetical protein